MSEWVGWLLGEGGDLDALHMTLRAVVVSIATITMIRIAGRRSFGLHRPFDACMAVLLGSVLSRAVTGASAFWPTLLAGLAVVLLHRLIALASVAWPWFEVLVSGSERELVRDGARDREQMRRALLTERDLDEAVRKRTGDERSPLKRAVLERDGTVTVQSGGSAGASQGRGADAASPARGRFH